LRDPKPLENQFWLPGKEDEHQWVTRISRQDFLAALFPLEGKARDVITVSGSWTSAFPTRESRIEITSALVNPETAAALARSLQGREEQKWPHHFPDEADNDDEFDRAYETKPYNLVGWLSEIRNDEGVDLKDSFRNGISAARRSPGKSICAKLSLRADPLPAKTWRVENAKATAIEQIVWSDVPEPYDDDGSGRSRQTQSKGNLLRIRADVLSSFLKLEQMDLIVSIHIERRLENEYGGRYDETTKKTKAFEKFFILRANGKIEDYEGTIGAW
jgi:hypothetical protein